MKKLYPIILSALLLLCGCAAQDEPPKVTPTAAPTPTAVVTVTPEAPAATPEPTVTPTPTTTPVLTPAPTEQVPTVTPNLSLSENQTPFA
ncbi:MAG: hypothetical protein IKK17_07705 [Oscillospiraceae bacterium]|nr:hypothetical protein [Oscillospiraceae bacterium]